MKKIEVKMDALAPVEFEFQMLGLLIASDKPSAAWLHRTDDGNQAFLDVVPPHNVPRQVLFMVAVALKINDPTAVALRQGHGRLPHLIGGPGHQSLEVFEQKLLRKEVVLHDRWMIQASQSSLHTHPIK